MIVSKQSNTMRVMVTISESTMPNWYAFLANIGSGHVRAEVIRAHLMEPGSVDVFRGRSNKTPSDFVQSIEQNPAEIGSAVMRTSPVEADPMNASSAREANSSAASVHGQAAQAASTAPASAGGLATSLIRSGAVRSW